MSSDKNTNRPVRAAREIGKIFNDLFRGREIKSTSDAIAVFNPPSPAPDPDDGGGNCCCSRVVTVAKEGSGDFGVIQDAIDYIGSLASPATFTEPWVVRICPGLYIEDVVGLDHVSLIGIGTREHTVIIQGVDGPTYTSPARSHSVTNILFKLPVSVITPNPIVLSAIIPPAIADRHVFNNCQFEIAGEAQPGRLVCASEVTVTLEGCHFRYTNTSTNGVNTHNIIDIINSTSINILACDFEINLGDPVDNLNIINEANQVINLIVRDCDIEIDLTDPDARGIYQFHNTVGNEGAKYLQDNRIRFHSTSLQTPTFLYANLFTPGITEITSNNNLVIYDRAALPTTISIALIGAGNTFNTHHDEFVDVLTGNRVTYANVGGIYNCAHADAPGIFHITRHYFSDDPPMVRGASNVNQPIIQGLLTPLMLQLQTYDTAELIDFPPNGMFTPPSTIMTVLVDGNYDIKAAFQFESLAAIGDVINVEFSLAVNGGIIAQGDVTLIHHFGVPHIHRKHKTLQENWPLTVGDIVNIQVLYTAGNPASALTLIGDVTGKYTKLSLHKDT